LLFHDVEYLISKNMLSTFWYFKNSYKFVAP
jgi:hypothetical protein